MAEPLADQIMRKVKQAADLYHRLMLVVAPAGAGKTTALQDVRDRTGAPLVNVNLELSRQMLDLTERQRALQLPRLLQDIVRIDDGEMILEKNKVLAYRSGGVIYELKSVSIADRNIKEFLLVLVQSENLRIVKAKKPIPGFSSYSGFGPYYYLYNENSLLEQKR